MQPRHKIFLTSLALLLVVITAHCQTKITEGRIEYENKYGKRVIRFKDDKVRVDNLFTDSTSDTVIYNAVTNVIIRLNNDYGTKTASYYNNDIVDDSMRLVDYIYFNKSNGTKNINGYKCKKAEYFIGNKKTDFYVYITTEHKINIPFYLNKRFFDLNGLPMEFNDKSGDGYEILYFKSISEEKIDESIFEIPKGYIKEYRHNSH